jgi:hypothetical protein
LWLDRSFAPGARFVLEIPVGPAQEVPHDDAAA